MALFQFGAGTEFWSLFAVYLIIQGLDGNLLVPVLFSEAVNLHPLVIILSVVIFGGLWGFWGVFFAIPLATLIKAVVHARRMVWRSTTKAMRIKTPGEGFPASCFASGVFFQPVQHHVVVIAGFEIIKDVFDFAIGIDEETNPVDPVVGFPHKGFFAPDAKLLANLMVFIRQQRKVQQLFSAKRESFSGLSVLMPSTSTPAFSGRPYYRASHACTVQPGVMAFGKINRHVVHGSRLNLLPRRLVR